MYNDIPNDPICIPQVPQLKHSDEHFSMLFATKHVVPIVQVIGKSSTSISCVNEALVHVDKGKSTHLAHQPYTMQARSACLG